MRISIEGPSDLDNHLEDLIINCCKRKKYQELRFNLNLFFFHIVLITEEKCICTVQKTNESVYIYRVRVRV